ncbi:MAG: hypothetical protein ABMA13_14825 [Chthoniobacteraceae bacterium]
MDHHRAIEVLVEIERAAEVNELRAGGLHLWPIVRLDFWAQLLRPPAERRASRVAARPRFGFIHRWRERGRLRALPGAEALFLSRHEDYGDRFDGAHYNRHTDPMFAFCRAKMSCVKLEGQESVTSRTLPRVEPTEFVRVEHLAAEVEPVVTGSESLRRALAELGESLAFDEANLRAQAADLLQRRDGFLAVLDRVQPRVVFVVCYYDRRVLPLIAACRERGIPTVDIQHGKQGVYHGAYTHWTRLPEAGYELLPDFFWLWGEASRRHIAASQPHALKRHRPLVGGNRWLAMWRDGDAFASPPLPARFRSATRVILVTLQPLDPPIPPVVREAVQRGPGDWLWLFRVHPQRRAEIPSLAASLAGNCEFEHASTAPLYSLLRLAHRHVTCWSSVAFEADALGVPTMIVHPSGRTLYADDIAGGRFAYGKSADELLAWVTADTPRMEVQPYIETSDRRADDALAEILAPR